jgi:hypothetical protein
MHVARRVRIFSLLPAALLLAGCEGSVINPGESASASGGSTVADAERDAEEQATGSTERAAPDADRGTGERADAPGGDVAGEPDPAGDDARRPGAGNGDDDAGRAPAADGEMSGERAVERQRDDVSDGASSGPQANETSGRDDGRDAAPSRGVGEDPPELEEFQRHVVALPAGFDGSVFTPPGRQDVTVANRSTDLLELDEAAAFMREALDDAGWTMVSEDEPGRDRLRMEADRGDEGLVVLLGRDGHGAGLPAVVLITVEHYGAGR